MYVRREIEMLYHLRCVACEFDMIVQGWFTAEETAEDHELTNPFRCLVESKPIDSVVCT